MDIRNWSLGTKLLVAASLIAGSGFLATLGTVSWGAVQSQTQGAQRYAVTLARQQGRLVQAFLEEGQYAARHAATALAGLKASGDPQREVARKILKGSLEQSPGILDIWTLWEADAWDGQDARNRTGSPDADPRSGRFNPIWVREPGGGLKLDLALLYDRWGETGAGDWYHLPRKRGQEMLMEPYFDEVAGQKILMTTVAVPIGQKAGAPGVVGTDIALASLQKSIETIRPFGAGYATVLSGEGLVLADGGGRPLGQGAADLGAFAGKTLGTAQERLEDARDSRLGVAVFRIAVPIRLDRTDQTWTFLVTVPRDEVLSEVRRTVQVAAGLGAASILVIVLLLRWLIRSQVTVPLGGEPDYASEVAHRVAAGELGQEVVLGEAQASSLLASLESMRRSLRAILQELSLSAGRVASGSMQLSATAEEMSHTTKEIAQSSEQNRTGADHMAAAMHQLAASIDAVSGHVAAADREVRGVVRATEAGEAAEHATQEAMQGIREVMEQIVRAVQVINEIARQTNLLSFNAAIEAAKAGELGMGFAVVAEEVRKLAERSGQGAKEITELTQACRESVQKGTRTVHASVAALQEIAQRTRQVASLVSEIGHASGEQARTGQEVARQVEEAARGSQTTAQATQALAATVHEVALTASELAHVADQLKSTSAHFRL